MPSGMTPGISSRMPPGIPSIPTSLAPPVPTNDLITLPHRSRSKSPRLANNTASTLKITKSAAPVPDNRPKQRQNHSNIKENKTVVPAKKILQKKINVNQHVSKNQVQNKPKSIKPAMPLPSDEAPEYGNFNMRVVKEPIYGNSSTLPGQFGSHDPIYDNF
jgi:hypothetical protein